jgi:miniconductance mechanosensitive channel
MALHAITIRNWDKSVTMIPTYKLLEVPYKNWRGMAEAGGRRIKRSIYIDLNSLRFCDEEMLDRYRRIASVKDFVEARMAEMDEWDSGHDGRPADPLAGRRLSNIDVFQAYVEKYLAGREDLHQEGLTLLVRQLAPGPTGLPVEVYAFTRTLDWAEYEAIQAEIVDHLLTALPIFDLSVFQQPTGADFRELAGPPSAKNDTGVQAFQ